MNILFITIGKLADINAPGIYTDLLRCYKKHGHEVYVVTAREKRNNQETEYRNEDGFHFLRVKIGNITKCGALEKGISTVLVERQYIAAMRKYLTGVKFDLVLYTTPPITFLKAVHYIKKRDGAKTYLLLKDIFPQNAVDIGMISKSGPKGLVYRHFRKQEKALYRISDHIGCMSQANMEYLSKHNPELNSQIIEVCPNTTDPVDMSCTEEERNEIRQKYAIPSDRKVFVYGGNLGKPQGIPFIIECLRKCRDLETVYFLLVGDGTEYRKLEAYIEAEKPGNVKLMQRLPKEDYDRMVGACDVGLIFLDHCFTIPNFPSRLLSYMQAKIPVLASTDPNTDIGTVICEGQFGWWCESNNADAFKEKVGTVIQSNIKEMGLNGFTYLNEHYTSEKAYQTIMSHFDC